MEVRTVVVGGVVMGRFGVEIEIGLVLVKLMLLELVLDWLVLLANVVLEVVLRFGAHI